jgi:hypothetical protein
MPGESFIESELACQLARNEKLIETIAGHHGDLHEVRAIDFFFFVNCEEDATGFVTELRSRGFEADTSPEPIDGKWPVEAVLEGTIAKITAAPFVEDLVRLAAKYLAEFDGWGTSVSRGG